MSFFRYRSDEFVTAQLSESGDRGRLSLKDWRLFAGVLPGLLVKCPEVNGVEAPTKAEAEAKAEQSVEVTIVSSASDSEVVAAVDDAGDVSRLPAVIGIDADSAEGNIDVEMLEMSTLPRHVSRLPGKIRSKSVESVSAAVAATTTAVLHAPGGHSSANADADAPASSSSSDASSTAAADSSVPAVIGAELASASSSASSSSSSDLDSIATAAHTSPPQLHAPGASSAAAAAAGDDENHVAVAVAESHVPAVVGAASSAAAKPSVPAASSSLHAPVGGGVLVSAPGANSDAAVAALGGSMPKLRSLHVWESAEDTDSWQMPSTLAGQLEAAQRCDLMQTVLAFEQLEVDIAFRADKARSLTLVEYRLVRERLTHLVREYQRRADELRYSSAPGRNYCIELGVEHATKQSIGNLSMNSRRNGRLISALCLQSFVNQHQNLLFSLDTFP